uniref:Uncharacterized protein n=1 Tax=Parascaris univalens TaxID=6257 RepID=A0A915ADB6_PARUN
MVFAGVSSAYVSSLRWNITSKTTVVYFLYVFVFIKCLVNVPSLANRFIALILVSGTDVPNPEPVGCRPPFKRCDNTPSANVYPYFIS